MTVPEALRRVLPTLRCPVCGDGLTIGDRSVRCPSGHSFDIARQGYLALLTGRGASTGDTAAMVAARDEVFAAGVLDLVVGAVADAAATPPGGVVVDLAGGTGHYLAAVLDRDPDASGLCLDASPPALRRAARVHRRAAAVAADAWAALPLASGSVSRALSVFGPRDADELQRVLADDGRLVVAAPAADHLGELVGPLGLVRVDPRKQERQAATFADFATDARHEVRYCRLLDRAAVRAVVSMGPSANHLGETELDDRLRTLPTEVEVTVAVDVTTYRR